MPEITYLRRDDEDEKYHIVPEERVNEDSTRMKSACGRRDFTRTTTSDHQAWLIAEDLCGLCQKRLAGSWDVDSGTREPDDDMLRRLYEMADEWGYKCENEEDMSPEEYEEKREEEERDTKQFIAKEKAKDLFE